MVTFIVVLILIAVVIAFAVLLIVKKGKLSKKWFISFCSVVLAGIICIAVAVPVTSNKVAAEVEDFEVYKEYRTTSLALSGYSQEVLKNFDEMWGEENAKRRTWLEEWKNRVSTGVYWDLNTAVRDKIMSLAPIYVVYENGKYILRA